MKNEFAHGIKKIFFGAIGILSASTSFMYFVQVFSGLADDQWLAILINGVVGVLVLDVAAAAWLKIYLGSSDNNTLRAMAATGFGIGLVGSAAASFAYLLSIAVDVTIPSSIQMYTQIVMAAIIVAHFVLVLLSSYKATSAKIDEKQAEMISEATDEMLKLTEEYFRDAIPALAQQNARVLARQLSGRFAQLTPPMESQAAITGNVASDKKKVLTGNVASEPQPVATTQTYTNGANGSHPLANGRGD